MRRLPFILGSFLIGLGLVPGCLDWESLYGPFCGDGIAQAGEACDDGNDDDDDACLSNCQQASCGDGNWWESVEGCDDGNAIPGDGCSPTCQVEPPTCGNGQLDPGEPCDDGNDSNEDSCLRGCSHAVCGDGFVRTGVEECDYGAVGLAACTKGCQTCINDERTYARAGAHCYEYHSELSSYGNARATCAENGGYVWAIAGALEANDVLSHLPAATLDTWLSFNTASMPFTWVTGESNKYQPWATGEPQATLPCTLNREVPMAASAWLSTACGEKHAFICERNLPNEDAVTHHAYKLRSDAMDFPSANEACTALGGHLLTIETEAEQEQLAKWFSLEVWLGAARGSDGQFTWLGGGPLSYTNWAPNQPDNVNKPEDCLTYGRNHFWNDLRCSVPRASICELE